MVQATVLLVIVGQMRKIRFSSGGLGCPQIILHERLLGAIMLWYLSLVYSVCATSQVTLACPPEGADREGCAPSGSAMHWDPRYMIH